MNLDLIDVSRWQFGITTVYHFIFVPLTIGLAPMVAVMQTAWLVTGKERWYRATRFFGTLFLVNFAMGVVTGIVQEFQFGMNWSEYSRFVGDVFGAPLALEGLAAFFIESIFLGVWIFGWDRVPRWIHLASIWMVAIAVNLSAYFIIVANSFMQHPVGAVYNEATGRAELSDIVELLTNSTALAAFPHAVFGSLLTAGTFVAGIAGWQMIRTTRRAENDPTHADAAELWRPAFRLALWFIVIGVIGASISGHTQAQLMFEQQPMKMASAEALCHTETDPLFSILSISTMNNCDTAVQVLGVPFVLSFLAGNQFTGVELQGVTELQAQYEQMFGPGNYTPNLFVTYWSFRMMIGLMAASMLLAVLGFWYTRKGRVPTMKWLGWASLISIPFPFLANAAGWVFTEMGRQPWVVHPNPDYWPENSPGGENEIHMIVDFGVSNHSVATVWVSLISFTLLYGVLAVIWFWLMRRKVLEGPLPPGSSENIAADSYGPDDDDGVQPLTFGHSEAEPTSPATSRGDE
ncbi:cytochrome ubiquinol oxidase subunit I [Corynebacterium alimapuense]|uniref:Cytochrome ubiquinol oxidase subunit I n=1 Tax=Corynebacterium alimapuense TaxID=1576874 RepID=A0A3M8K9K6_9CORY|nr:cytochrome ubiquinol oxidase subunit I [Corynebacterium alimapuense]RNE49816.1 cytochrome ubiquinol oxidase subunit I [Corynebacterium alimapuense]